MMGTLLAAPLLWVAAAASVDHNKEDDFARLQDCVAQAIENDDTGNIHNSSIHTTSKETVQWE